MTHSQMNKPMTISKTANQAGWLFTLLVLLFAALYLFNISGWLINGDEGTDLYEVWQLQVGNQPGVDFIAEQQPLFLLLGKLGLGFSDDSAQSIKVLRLFSAVQVLAGTVFLGLVVKRLWDVPTAALTFGLTLASGLVYEQARLFRPDPMMFAWELVGLGFVLLAVKLGKRPYWAGAGLAYGIAFLMKPFGIFPVIGLAFFFLYLFIRQTKQWRAHLLNGLTFAIPFLLISGGVSLILYSQLGFYYQEAFQQHLSLGQEKTVQDQIAITLVIYLRFILFNAVVLFILPLALLNRRSGEKVVTFPEKQIVWTQLLVPFLFIFVTRPLYPRYLIFLMPPLALLLGLQLKGVFNKIPPRQPYALVITSLLIFGVAGFAIFSTFPSVTTMLTQQEDDTIALAHYIQANTEPNEVVLGDYAGLNFHAKRPSIYEASIIAGGRIKGGIITGALLVERMEASQPQLVLLHVEGRNPDHLIHLIDFEVFADYLADNYQLIDVFDRAGQIIEIYQRQ